MNVPYCNNLLVIQWESCAVSAGDTIFALKMVRYVNNIMDKKNNWLIKYCSKIID